MRPCAFPLHKALFLLAFTGMLSAADLTVEGVANMADKERAEFLTGFVSRAEASLAANREKSATQQDRRSQQVALSITIALFGEAKEGRGVDEGKPWGTPIGVDSVLRTVTGSDRQRPFGEFIGSFVEKQYARFQKRPALAWLPQQNQSYQVAYFKMFFTAPPMASIDCRTMYDKMTTGARHALVERAAVNNINKLGRSVDASGATLPATTVQQNRRLANLLTALFLSDQSSTTEPPMGYERASCGITDKESFLDHISDYMGREAENLAPWVKAEDTDGNQQNDFRYLLTFEHPEEGNVNAWFSEAAFSHMQMAVADERVKIRVHRLGLADLREAIKTVTVYHDGRPAVSGGDKLEAQLKPLNEMMPRFTDATERVLSEFLNPLISPIDKEGRHKQLSDAVVQRRRANQILKVVSGNYSDEIGDQIYAAYRRNPVPVDFDAIFRQYIAGRLPKQ